MRNIIGKIIIFVIIFIIIISILILIYSKKTSQDNVEESIDSESFEISVNENIERVTLDSEFYNVRDCVQYYIDYLNDKNYDAIYKILGKNFINSNKITVENLKDKNTKLNGAKFIATKINKVEKDLDIVVYFVHGILMDNEYKSEEEKDFTVIIDNSQSVFSIIPENLENESSYEYNLQIEDDTTDYYNEFIYQTYTEEEVLTEYFDYYKNLAMNNYSKAFLLLDEEFRNKRFNNNEEEYEKYLKNINIENVFQSKYKYNIYEDYKEYICIDKQGLYYIFKETAPMEFKLILDTYTIDLPEFTEKYNKGNEQVKVGMNIEKVITALNNKDYNYIYDKLDDSFKNNNFNTIEQFEAYMNTNFFNTNKVEYEKFSKEGETYIYELKIKESDEDNANSKDVTIIMKLLEDTNFVMSFSMN